MLVQSQLIAPIAGVVGVLLGAALTQLLSLLRERLQWEREVQNRGEERAREDRQRWADERLAAYSDVLTKVSEWRNLAVKSRYGEFGESQRVELRDATERVNAARDRLDLFAPEKIRATARSVAASMLLYEMDRMMAGKARIDDRKDDSKAKRGVEEELDQIYQHHSTLREEIRADLGISEQDPDPNITERRQESRASQDLARPQDA